MSLLVLERAPLTIKLRDVLRASQPAGAGLRGEVSRPPAPIDPAIEPEPPYFVLHPLDGGQGFFGAGWYSPDNMGEFMYQITFVGRTAVQCEAAADRARTVLLGRNSNGFITSLDATPSSPFAGIKVMNRESMGGGFVDADSVMVNLHERYVFGCCLP